LDRLSPVSIPSRWADRHAQGISTAVEWQHMTWKHRIRTATLGIGLTVALVLAQASTASAGHKRYRETVYVPVASAPVVYAAPVTYAAAPVYATPVAFVRPAAVVAPAPIVVPATRIRPVRTTVYVAEPVNVVYRPYYVYP
jgi:hypothetical protein